MTGADLAALIAGTGVLMLAFAAYQIASHSLLDSRMRIFVKRAPVMVPVSVRRPRKVSSVAWVEQWNKRLRQVSYARRIQGQLVRAGLDMQASRWIVIQVIVAAMAFLVVWFFTSGVKDLKGFPALAPGSLAMVVAWYIPNVVLKFLESQRLKKLERQ